MRSEKIINFSEAKEKVKLKKLKYVGKISIVMTSKKVCNIKVSEDIINDTILELFKRIYSNISIVKRKSTRIVGKELTILELFKRIYSNISIVKRKSARIVGKELTILLYIDNSNNKGFYYKLDGTTNEEAKSILQKAITYLKKANKKE